MSKELSITDELKLIASIEAQTKKATDAYKARQEGKLCTQSLMYGTGVDPNTYAQAEAQTLPCFGLDWEFSRPTEALKLKLPKPKIDFAWMTDEAYKAMLAMTTKMLRQQSLTVGYIQHYIEASARQILPVHVFEDTNPFQGRITIATHKPVPDDIKAHFEGMRPVGSVIEYQQLAIVPWPDPVVAKSPIPPKVTPAAAAPAAAAPAAPATKAFPTNALKHGWTKHRGMR